MGESKQIRKLVIVLSALMSVSFYNLAVDSSYDAVSFICSLIGLVNCMAFMAWGIIVEILINKDNK